MQVEPCSQTLPKCLGELKVGKDLQCSLEQAVRILLFISFWHVNFLFGKDPFPTRMGQLVLEIS